MEETALSLSEKEINSLVSKIQKTVAGIEEKASKGYLSIVADVAKIRDSKAYKNLSYKNISEMCADLFRMSKSTTYNLLSIYDRFGEGYKLTEEASGKGVRELLEIISEEKKAKLEDKSSKAKVKAEAEAEEAEAEAEEAPELMHIIDTPYTFDTVGVSSADEVMGLLKDISNINDIISTSTKLEITFYA